MSDSAAKAVFLSYASQDAEAAKGIADALRAAGVEVWFDQSELVGGDQWDAKIRKQIKECALLIPVVSANTQSRTEGYFRLEWRLADQRTHLMAKGRPFLLPVVIDDTHDADAHVPDSFMEVQWTRLPGGGAADKFSERVRRLLLGSEMEAARPRPAALTQHREPGTGNRRLSRLWWVLPIFGVTMALLLLLKEKGPAHREAPVRSMSPSAAATTPAQELVAKAQAIVDQGDELNRETYALAEELLIKAEQLDVSEASAWILHAQISSALIGYALDDSTTRREALRAQANRAVQLAPASLAAQLVECDSLIAFGQNVPGIVERLQALAAKYPENWRVFDLLSEGLRLEGKFTEGLAANERALQLAPDNFLVKGNRLSLLSRTGDWATAEKELEVMMRGRTSARILAFNVLLKLVWRGDPAGAVAAVQNWPAWFLLEDRGVVHAVYAALWNRNPVLALQFVQKYPRDYIRDYMFTGPTAVLSAWANEQAGNLEAARADWRVVQQVAERELQARPNEAYALHWKAWSLARLGDTASAAPILQQLMEGNSSMRNMARVLGRFGALALTMGRSDVALAQIAKEPRVTTKSILRLNPVFDPLRDDPRFRGLIESAPGPQESKQVGAVASAADDKSVAVLAFANLSDDKANEYFSDGISEELLNVLAKVPGLKVSARTSAFYFKGKEVPVPEIAKQLGVAYVVEGSVRKQGDKVRITAQLIKAADGFHVWSDTFTRDLKDIFAVQDEIAGLIAKNLQLKMGMEQVAARRAIDPGAYQEYLVGRAMLEAGTTSGARAGLVHFERAVALEPNFTAAWVQLARTYVHLARWGGLPEGSDGNEAKRAVERAVRLEPESPDVLLALGWVRRTIEWNWRGAEEAFRQALKLRPNHAETIAATAVLLANLGQEQESIALAQRAAELDPLNAATQLDLVIIFYSYGHFAEATQAGRRALQLAPDGQHYHGWLAMSLAEQRRFAEAVTEAGLESDEITRLIAQALTATKQGRVAEAWERMRELEAKASSMRGLGNIHAYVAHVYGNLGETGKGIDHLEKAREARDPSIAWARTSLFAGLHADPRWPEFLRTLGLADEQLK